MQVRYRKKRPHKVKCGSGVDRVMFKLQCNGTDLVIEAWSTVLIVIEGQNLYFKKVLIMLCSSNNHNHSQSPLTMRSSGIVQRRW